MKTHRGVRSFAPSIGLIAVSGIDLVLGLQQETILPLIAIGVMLSLDLRVLHLPATIEKPLRVLLWILPASGFPEEWSNWVEVAALGLHALGAFLSTFGFDVIRYILDPRSHSPLFYTRLISLVGSAVLILWAAEQQNWRLAILFAAVICSATLLIIFAERAPSRGTLPRMIAFIVIAAVLLLIFILYRNGSFNSLL